MRIVVSLISGLIMAAGLIISDMINPDKVIGFLDVFGQFDPTLAFVMAGALVVAGIGFRLISISSKPRLCDTFDMPSKTRVDAPLVSGAVIFGIGWGLAGYCPGPAIVGATLGTGKAVIFVAAMASGMYLAKYLIDLKKF